MGKKKPLKYRPVRQNETLDISVALSQASALLDQAAAKAMQTNDAFMLVYIADKWIEIAKIFEIGEEELDEHVDTDSGTQYGFCVDKKEEVTDEDE